MNISEVMIFLLPEGTHEMKPDKDNFVCPVCGKSYNDKWEIIEPGNLNILHFYHSNEMRIGVKARQVRS